jgi:hypothetical protein
MSIDVINIKLQVYANLLRDHDKETEALAYKKEIISLLAQYETFLKGKTVDQLEKIKYRNDAELRYLKLKLLDTSDSLFRSWHDKIFKNILKFNLGKKRVTHIFEQFIRGITMFENETTNINTKSIAYHRDRSCGSYDMTRAEYKSSRSCAITNDIATLKANRLLIYKCYLERLVYDAIYKQYTLFFPQEWDQESSQDEGHRRMLDDVKKDFESCYPNTNLQIEVFYNDDNIPYMLRVMKQTIRLGQPIEYETYIKMVNDPRSVYKYEDTYLENVYCEKEISDAKLYKLQRYDKPTKKWSKKTTLKSCFDEAKLASYTAHQPYSFTRRSHMGFRPHTMCN